MKRTSLSLFVLAALLCLPSLMAQTSTFTLNQVDQAHLDSLAALTAKKIKAAKVAEKEPAVLVIDFFRNSPGTSSQLGSILADRFSELLSSYPGGMKVLDRKTLNDYLTENWTTLEDLRSYDVSFRIARQLGATSAVLGTLTEENDRLDLTLHLEGLGSIESENDLFAWRDRTGTFARTEELHTELYEPGPNYKRSADEIPQEPGVFIAGMNGATFPKCIYCPNPEFSDAAHAAQFQGTVLLSVVVDAQGHVGSIYVIKGAPFGLTAQAIKATKSWHMEPGQKDGNPVPVRVPIEIAFRLLSGPDQD